jgi:hypothetical protein
MACGFLIFLPLLAGFQWLMSPLYGGTGGPTSPDVKNTLTCLGLAGLAIAGVALDWRWPVRLMLYVAALTAFYHWGGLYHGGAVASVLVCLIVTGMLVLLVYYAREWRKPVPGPHAALPGRSGP